MMESSFMTVYIAIRSTYLSESSFRLGSSSTEGTTTEKDSPNWRSRSALRGEPDARISLVTESKFSQDQSFYNA